MKEIYGVTKILLAPSQWDEAWGRISTEAQFSGIPVIGSNRGGLTESIGDGGILIEPDAEISAWSDAIRTLWHDEALYDELSSKASKRSNRDQINREKQLQSFARLLRKAMEEKKQSNNR